MTSSLVRLLGLLFAFTSAAAAAGNDWMSCLDGSVSISQYSIPGTHDSGALLEPFPGTARTQSLTIDQQLAAGVRFLDIRCRHENDSFAIYHGFVPQGINFDIVLLSVFNFLEANPGEAVIMSVKEEFDPLNNTRSFEATFDSYVAQNPGGWRLAAATPTLDEARGKIVLFRRFGASSTPKGIDASSFPDNTTFTTGGRMRVQDRYVVTDNDAKWDAIHGLLGEAKYGAPDMLYVNFCSGYRPGAMDVPDITVVSNDINARLTDFFTNNTSGHFGTILMDFADEAKTALIYNTNFPAGRTLHQPAYFTIVNRSTGKAIDLIAGSTSNGAQINQWDHDGGPNQRWALAPTENADHFRIHSWVSGRSATIQGNSNSPGAKLLSVEYANPVGNPAQQFDLVDAGDGFYKIRNVNSNLVLEVEGAQTGNGARIQQAADSGANHQHWWLEPWGSYSLRATSGKYLATADIDSPDGDAIVQDSYQRAPWFQWRFESAGDGHLRASSDNAPQRVISVPGASTSAGADCKLADYDAANSGEQKLHIIPKTNGRFEFEFVHSGMVWEIPLGATADLTPLQQNTNSADAWQEFQLERVDPLTLAGALLDWRCEHFTVEQIYDPALEATVWGHDANPDGDPHSNFEEFAFGGDPNADGDQIERKFSWLRTPGTNEFTATFPRLRGSLLDYELLVSEDLILWEALTASAEGAGSVIDARYGTAVITHDFDLTAERRRFVKVRVTE